jgi:hypothetical protein
MKKILLVVIVLMPCVELVAQKNARGLEYHVKKSGSSITIDGDLSEEAWKTAASGTDFFMSKPIDSIPPVNQTIFHITFDDEFLFLGFICIDDGKGPVVQSLRRDFEFGLNDNVGIYIDPFNDFTNGFYMNITPYGVQREGIIANGGSSSGDYSTFWDNKWYSAVIRHDDRWVAELAIPLKSIRYNRDTWNFNVLRNDAERNQVSSWIATPVQYLPAAFGWSGKMIWDDPLPVTGANISIIPYVAGGTFKDVENGKDPDNEFNAGFDAKIGLTPSLNLDLTVNPDFSQVEVDRQVINLTRVEFGFPERRQFFLENSDLFAQPGFPDTRPFFSRRIGLAADSSGALQRVPVLYGMRMSGKIGKDWRLGVMNLQTQKKSSLGLPAQNYSVAVVQRQVFARSNIGFVIINKESLGLDKTYDPTRFYHKSLVHQEIKGNDTTHSLNRYNRVYGLDFNIFSKDTRLRGDIYYHRSLDAFNENKNYSGGAFLGLFTRRNDIAVGINSLGENFNAEVGFVPNLRIYKKGYTNALVMYENRTFPQSRSVASFGPNVQYSAIRIYEGRVTDQNLSVGYKVQFLNTAQVNASVNYTFQQLTTDFNPTRDETFDKYAADERFSWTIARIGYTSDIRKLFNYQINVGYGTFYSGSTFNLNGELNYRYQPFGSLSVRFDYNDIDLPENYGQKRILLVGPRIDLTFTDKLFLTTFVQYNDLEENVNLNARFQWRFKPASDFFVVYTENYLPAPFSSKNRALVLKLTYWLNL